jgi:RNA polymerase sigma-70 factor (ECF subfamily)
LRAAFPSCGNFNFNPVRKEEKLATHDELDKFLASIERKAYKHAVFAMHDSHTAMDVVQDAMLKLSEKYGDKPAGELPLLFHRILQNAIRDQCRRQKVRSNWFTLFSAFDSKKSEEEFDPLDILEDSDNQSAPAIPDAAFDQKQTIGLIENALSNLPARQREAFLLRYWEELDTTETANVMGCSEGSVKTHCSRANHTLAIELKAKGVKLT